MRSLYGSYVRELTVYYLFVLFADLVHSLLPVVVGAAVLLRHPVRIAKHIPAFTLYAHQAEPLVAFHATVFVFLPETTHTWTGPCSYFGFYGAGGGGTVGLFFLRRNWFYL
jgi:hypothetical protein